MTDHRNLPRQRHIGTAGQRDSAELKEKILAECAQPGASLAGVALAHGIKCQRRAQVAAPGPKSRGLGNSY
jgi:transposase-like protein